MFATFSLTDMETCKQVFRCEVLRGILIEDNRLVFKRELTANFAKGWWRLCAVGISYQGRTHEESSKNGWRDVYRAIHCILKYNLTRSRYRAR